MDNIYNHTFSNMENNMIQIFSMYLYLNPLPNEQGVALHNYMKIINLLYIYHIFIIDLAQL